MSILRISDGYRSILEVSSYSSRITINLGTKNLIKIVLAIQLAVFGAIGLDFVGIQIPILRQVICFIYLAFIPGILLLRVLKLYDLSLTQTILYSVGLSLSLLMFIGVLINFFYPLIGISKPISEAPLVITITIVVLSLVLILYLRDREYSQSLFINIDQVFSPQSLFLCLLPFLAIFGTYLLNFYDNNSLLLLLLTILSVMPVIVISDKFPSTLYPFAIWTSTLALLFHWSLSTAYLPISDGILEYHFSDLVFKNHVCFSTYPVSANSLPSVTIIPPIFCIVAKINLTWFYKIGVPVFASLVPVVLYLLYKEIINDKIGILASLFFSYWHLFFTWIAMSAAKGIGYLFLALSLSSLFTANLSELRSKVVLIIFSTALVLSHYGSSYFFLLFLFASYCIYLIRKENPRVELLFLVLYVVISFSWYMYNTDSIVFKTLVRLGHHMVNELLSLSLKGSYTLEYLTRELPITLEITKYLYYISYLLIGIGLLIFVVRPRSRDEKLSETTKIFTFLSIAFYPFPSLSLLPSFSRIIAFDRVVHTLLFLLAPYCIVGAEYLLKAFKFGYNASKGKVSRAAAVFLVIFITFNSGIVSDLIVKDYFLSCAINRKEALEYGSIENKNYCYGKFLSTYDVVGAIWLSNYRGNMTVYGDFRAIYPLVSYGGLWWGENFVCIKENLEFKADSLLFLRYSNIVDGIISTDIKSSIWFNASTLDLLISAKDKIYHNGGCEIYYLS